MIFIKNYLYELPDDIQTAIYKNVFASCIAYIDNDKNIKYLSRLYRATNNPNNTCIYSIKPKGMFNDYIEYEYAHKYKYERVALIEGFNKNNLKSLIYLDRKHLIQNTSLLRCNIISVYIYPLFTASRNLRKYLSIRFNFFLKYHDKEMIKYIIVVDDRVDIVFEHNFKCNADIYYNVMVSYNVLYNSLSNIIYSEENIVMFNKFAELFRWIEMNNILEGYNIYNNKIIPVFEGKLSKN